MKWIEISSEVNNREGYKDFTEGMEFPDGILVRTRRWEQDRSTRGITQTSALHFMSGVKFGKGDVVIPIGSIRTEEEKAIKSATGKAPTKKVSS